ncbi:MAG: hypothetical protein FJ138_15345, partial [Deltaproteobacteria bacterium]|nr:hypothetical protein [Deltaproteobacteria bacterium]
MKLTCPQCQTAMQLDPVAIPEEGAQVECYSCLHTFAIGGAAGAPPAPAPVGAGGFDVDFAAIPAAPAAQAAPRPVDVGAALFGGDAGFGFDMSAPPA